MKTLQFKTNINCGSCVANVTPFLQEEKRIKSWNVDTKTAEKFLTIEAEDTISADEVKKLLESAGYNAEQL